MAAGTVEVEYSDNEDKYSGQDSDDGDIESEGDVPQGNQGWADAMAAVLQKPLADKQPVILSKSHKAKKRKAEQKEEIKKKKAKAQERHAVLEKDHVIPDRSNLDYDRNLVRIATRGVVKLFNAVSKHQKEMDAKLKKATTETKKSKVMESMTKSAFLDMLKSSSDKPRIDVSEQESEVVKKKPSLKEIQKEQRRALGVF